MAETLDKLVGVADIYASALFELAQERGIVAEVRSDLEELVKLRELAPEANVVLVSPAIHQRVREALLERMFRGKLTDEVLNTLLVLNAHGRHGVLPTLLNQFIRRQLEAAGQIQATATSAVDLGPDEKAAIEKVAAAKSGKKPLVTFRVDPAILGGLILQIGDLRYDNSIRSQLAAAKALLAARSERGVQISTTS